MHFAKSGRLILRMKQGASSRAGELVFDETGRRVGRIIEFMGPTTAPYASVIPMTDRKNKLIGAKLFSGSSSDQTRKHRAVGSKRR